MSVAGVVRTTDRPTDDRRTLAPLGRRTTSVVERRQYGAYRVLTVADPTGPAPDPGQFYMLTAAERWGGGEDERPFLPRAFSVLRTRDGLSRGWHGEKLYPARGVRASL